jgi:hypothetical protein
MNNYTLILCTGAPGSGWSRISRRFKKSFNNFDLSDETPERAYVLPEQNRIDYQVHKDNWQGKTHLGSYFGPYHEFGDHFDDISNHYTKEQFLNECVKPFLDSSKSLKLVRSHWFAYNLDWIWENCKGHKLFLIWRDPECSKNWWYSMGGWNINYPIYKWYDNPEKMWIKIQEEANNVLEFAQRKNIKWQDYSDFDEIKSPGGFGESTAFKFKVTPPSDDTIKIAIVDIV